MSGQVEEGDKVSWTWGGAHPSGTTAEVKPGEVTVTSHRGNDITKTGTEENPAVHIERSGNDLVKTANELHIDQKSESNAHNANGGTSNGTSESKPEEKPEQMQEENKLEPEPQANNQEAQKAEEEKPEPETGDKRKADEQTDANPNSSSKEDVEKESEDAKKQKTENGTAALATDGSKKGPGRPKGVVNGEKKVSKREKKAPTVGRADRKTRSQGNAD